MGALFKLSYEFLSNSCRYEGVTIRFRAWATEVIFIMRLFYDFQIAHSIVFPAMFGLGGSAMPLDRVEFVVNRPFYFIIRAYQEQLFAGIFNG